MKRLVILLCIAVVSCKGKQNGQNEKDTAQGDTLSVDYAEGFSIVKYGDYKILKVKNPYPDAEKTFTYLLAEKGATVPNDLDYDEKVQVPINKIVVTSTTHIPSLESLDEENSLVGFPHVDYISSKKTRQRIADGNIKELGENENINTEILLNLQPDVVIGFTMKANNKTYSTISKSGIPVVYNGDWNEKNPLGKAEWIKFFGAFYNKDKKAKKLFNQVKTAYNSAKKTAQKATEKPTVLAGAMYKDVWYLPNGQSWAAQFIADANADYLYKDTTGSGSLSLAFETVLNKAQHADFWIAPGSRTSYEGMEDASAHYREFDAFENKNIYSYAGVKGETGGVLYYELAPNRPDLVLKDLIHIFHPELMPDYENTFFKALQ